jgi:peptide chain release factor 2
MFDLAGMESRRAELQRAMEAPEFWTDPEKAAAVNRERKRLEEQLGKWTGLAAELSDAEVLLQLAEEEDDAATAKEAVAAFTRLDQRLGQAKFELMLSGEHDAKDCFLYINSGAGGTEAMDWTGMLARMYLRYCERQGLAIELIDEQPGDEAGLKSITLAVHGQNAYGYLRAESGVHRLVRISPFDANKRRHTSFAAVSVMPDIEEEIEVAIDPDDLRIDTYRASGHGGQKVNKTSSAVRITHLPTGIVVQCQNERSQHKNKAFAMKVLKARIYALEERKQQEKIDKLNADKKDIEWGSQIRSYVMQPYQMVKDLRSGYETGNIQAVLDGDLQPFIEHYLMMKTMKDKAQAPVIIDEAVVGAE